jgi:hypothetical protein
MTSVSLGAPVIQRPGRYPIEARGPSFGDGFRSAPVLGPRR